MSSADGIFMIISAALGPESKSFEEVRIEDYLTAYQTTGRPPVPVPQEPTDELQRKVLNLPPLFKPQTNPTSSSSPLPSSTSLGVKPRIINPSEIPVGQEFHLHAVAGEKYHHIACMPEYEGFSVEELRYYAYLRGNITPPMPLSMDPFVQVNKEPTVASSTAASEDKLQSLCAQPEYNRHSPEELRVAFLLSGREMTSAELLSQLPTSSATPALAAAAPIINTTPASIPQPIFASATPSAPKFAFAFR